MAPLELATQHLASSWHPKAPRLGNTKWLYDHGPILAAAIAVDSYAQGVRSAKPRGHISR